MIVLSELPFSFAENEFFEEWVQKYLQPQFHSISRNTAIRMGHFFQLNVLDINQSDHKNNFCLE